MGHEVSFGMDQRGLGVHGLVGIPDHGQDLVLHPDQLLGFGQNFRGFGSHDADGIA